MILQKRRPGSLRASTLWIGVFASPLHAGMPFVPDGPANPAGIAKTLPVHQRHADKAPTRYAGGAMPVARTEHSFEFKEHSTAFKRAFADLYAKRANLDPAEFRAEAESLVPQLAALEPVVSAPLDRLVHGDWQRQVGSWTSDSALIVKGLQAMLDSGLLQPNLVPTTKAMLRNIAFAAKDYPTVIRLLSPLQPAPVPERFVPDTLAPGPLASDDAMPQMLAEAYAATNQPQAGLDVLKSAISARMAAHRAVPVDWYRRGLRIAFNAKMSAEAIAWSQLLLTTDPSPLRWLGAAQMVRLGYPNFTDEEELDLARLLDQTGALKLEARYSRLEYLLYLKAIDPHRFPGEAMRIAEQGISIGVLKPDDPFVENLVLQARAQASADTTALTGRANDAAATASGKLAPGVAAGVAAGMGDAWLSDSDSAKAEESYTLALTKGVAEDQDRVQTRLGIARIELGKYADAKATLGKVAGPRAAIAQLWAIFADQKAAAK